jgi:hypothetical protein
MRTKEIKTIDVQAKEWFDKINGNSYFSANVTINYGLKNAISFYMPMQYGYGDHVNHVAFKEIKERLKCFKKDDTMLSYWRVYDSYKIIARHTKRDVLKRDL